MAQHENASNREQVEIENTVYVHEKRPYIVKATARDREGNVAEGIGTSFTSIDSAREEASEQAQNLAREYDVGFEVLNLTYNSPFLFRKLTIDASFRDGEFEVKRRTSFLPKAKVRVSGHKNGKQRDASSRVLLQPGMEEKAIKSAVEDVAAQLR